MLPNIKVNASTPKEYNTLKWQSHFFQAAVSETLKNRVIKRFGMLVGSQGRVMDSAG